MAEKKRLFALKNVVYAYSTIQRRVLDTVSLTIDSSEIIGIIGPNGGGKTTLVKLLCKLLEPTSGTVQLAPHLKIGYVGQRISQSDAIFPASVLDVVGFGLAGTDHGSHQKQLITDALSTVGMESHTHQRFGELSGGQQQRVLIAKALVGKPEVLVLDEPTVGIDVKSQASFYELVTKLGRERNITIILVSHDQHDLLRVVSRVLYVNGGVLFDGPTNKYLTSTYHMQTHDCTITHKHHVPAGERR